MTIPPIVRLSQALYSDVPQPVTARSCRKRSHAANTSTDTAAAAASTVIRLLLPRTFAVADRAYHDSVAAVGCGKAPQEKAGATGCACCGGDAASLVQPQQLDRDGPTGEHDGTGTGTDTSSDSDSSQRQPPCSIRLATQAGAVLVVVESVLGFSAVCGLLDRSGREKPPLGDSAACLKPQDSVANGSDEGGISEAVGRLVGWFLIAAARTTFPSDGSSSGITRRPTPEAARNATRTENARHALSSVGLDLGSDDLDFAVADGQAHGALYGVSGQCEGGAEWRAFDLEPKDVTALGKTSGGGDTAHSAAGEVLEVRLICHPLVTMAPDIRWCLRLIGQAKAFATLLNANAKLSTLGGGYFLTRQVGQAIRLALAQAEVATALGDLQLAGKCRVNVAYNYIWLGQYAEAQRILQAQVAASRAIHDEELENIASIAGRFLRRSRKANRHLLLQCQHGGSSGGGGGGGDNGGGTNKAAGQKWVRQRIDVKTDEWHRVRALPMYCSSGRATPVGWGGEAARIRQGST